MTAERRLESDVVDLLRSRGLSLAVAESLTGGSLSATIVSVAGASDVYRGGVTTYAPDTKVALLGVSESMIKRGGTVQGDVASQMAAGARALLSADIAVATTGVAGPGPSEGHPAGTVFIGYADAYGTAFTQMLFVGDREQVRNQTVQSALTILVESLSTDR